MKESAFAAALACGAASMALAQDVPRTQEEVIVVAPTPVDGEPVDTLHFPGNIQHVSARPSPPTGGDELTDLLASSGGSLHLASPQGGDFEPDVFFRGFESSPLLGTPQGISVYQDGVRLNETFGDSVHWSLIPPGAIASVDLLPGSDPLFGLNTIGGAVSIHTKNGFSDPGSTARVSGGSYGYRAAAIESGGHEGRLGWFVAADALAEDGWRDDSPSRLARVFTDGTWQSDGLSIDLTGEIASSHVAGNGTVPPSLLAGYPAAVFTSPDRSSTGDALLSARARVSLSPSTTMTLNLSGRWTSPDSSNGDATPYFPCASAPNAGLLCADSDSGEQVVRDQSGRAVPAAGLDAVLNRTEARERDLAATAEIESSARWLGMETRFVAGASAELGTTRYASTLELAGFDATRAAAGSGLFVPDAAIRLRSTRTNLAGFFSESIALAPAVGLMLGGRFDHSRIDLDDEIGEALNGDHRVSRFDPTAGLTWQTGKSAVAFASYSEAFRAPTPVELTCADPEAPCRLPNAFVSDPPLRPVTARTLETGFRGREGSAEWSAAVFRTETENDIVFVANGAARGQGFFENVGRTRRQGLELRIAGSRTLWSWSLDYSYIDARFRSAFFESSPEHPDAVDGTISVRPGDRIPSIPAHNLKLGARVRISSRLSAGAEALFLSDQTLRGDESNQLAPIPAQFRVDADMSFRLGKGCEAFAGVTNAFNRHDIDFGQVASAQPILAAEDGRFVSPSPPRLLRAGVKLSF